MNAMEDKLLSSTPLTDAEAQKEAEPGLVSEEFARNLERDMNCWVVWGKHIQEQYLQLQAVHQRLEEENQELRSRRWWSVFSR